MTRRKVKMRLDGEDGNAAAILGRFKRAARKAGWTEAEVAALIAEATAGTYDDLLQTIMAHVDEDDEGDE